MKEFVASYRKFYSLKEKNISIIQKHLSDQFFKTPPNGFHFLRIEFFLNVQFSTLIVFRCGRPAPSYVLWYNRRLLEHKFLKCLRSRLLSKSGISFFTLFLKNYLSVAVNLNLYDFLYIKREVLYFLNICSTHIKVIYNLLLS